MIARALFVLFAGGCCCGAGGGECEVTSFRNRCERGGYTFCETHHGYGMDFGNTLTHVTCGDGYECVDRGLGQVACVLGPPTTCDPETFVGRCQDGERVICTTPNELVTDSYVLLAGPCLPGTSCVVVDDVAQCHRPP